MIWERSRSVIAVARCKRALSFNIHNRYIFQEINWNSSQFLQEAASAVVQCQRLNGRAAPRASRPSLPWWKCPMHSCYKSRTVITPGDIVPVYCSKGPKDYNSFQDLSIGGFRGRLLYLPFSFPFSCSFRYTNWPIKSLLAPGHHLWGQWPSAVVEILDLPLSG